MTFIVSKNSSAQIRLIAYSKDAQGNNVKVTNFSVEPQNLYFLDPASQIYQATTCSWLNGTGLVTFKTINVDATRSLSVNIKDSSGNWSQYTIDPPLEITMRSSYGGRFILDNAYFAYRPPECIPLYSGKKLYDFTFNNRSSSLFDLNDIDVSDNNMLVASALGSCFYLTQDLTKMIISPPISSFNLLQTNSPRIGYQDKTLSLNSILDLPVKTIQIAMGISLIATSENRSLFKFSIKTLAGNFKIEVFNTKAIYNSTFGKTLDIFINGVKDRTTSRALKTFFTDLTASHIGVMHVFSLRLEPLSANTIKWEFFLNNARSPDDAIASGIKTLDSTAVSDGLFIGGPIGAYESNYSFNKIGITNFVAYSDLKPYNIVHANARAWTGGHR